jgi:hypothetical protein
MQDLIQNITKAKKSSWLAQMVECLHRKHKILGAKFRAAKKKGMISLLFLFCLNIPAIVLCSILSLL